jgi:pentatricopeptide repeat protein
MVFAKVFEKAKKRKVSSASETSSLPGGAAEVKDGGEKKSSKKKRPPKKKRKREQQTNNGCLTIDDNSNNSHDERQPSSIKKQKKRPPKKKLSQQALDLSSELQECSRKKDLSQALEHYWNCEASIRDGFHACIVIDCCARCGAMDQAEQIVTSLKSNGRKITVETQTALIKGYSHAGNIAAAVTVFESMCHSKNPADRPNVRTLNTLLRGCLWTAAQTNPNNQIYGGVVSSEAAWKFMSEKCSTSVSFSTPFDISSYEYSISLLCQALRISEAETRIQELQSVYGITVQKNQLKGGTRSVLETLAVSYVGLTRAHALLGDQTSALAAGQLAQSAIQAAKETAPASEDNQTATEKRGWKSSENDARRNLSNAMFRDHRLSELELSLQSIRETCQAKHFPPSNDVLARRLVHGLYYFSGGGTTKPASQQTNPTEPTSTKKKEKETTNSSSSSSAARTLRRSLLNASWQSFGLAAALNKCCEDLTLPPPHDFLRVKDCERIVRRLSSNNSSSSDKAIHDNGTIDFFPGQQCEKPLDIELGSGFGDWIVDLAAKNKDTRNYIAVELRADRVASIFAKAMLSSHGGPLENLVVVGGDGTTFLSDRIIPESVSTIFVNHPEPPTQDYGRNVSELQGIMDGSLPEPAHMLSSATLMAAAQCLMMATSRDEQHPQGQIVIVTDNKCYARLICATVIKVNKEQPTILLRSLQKLADNSSSRCLEVEETFHDDNNETTGSNHHRNNSNNSVFILRHVVSSNKNKGTSYFDRLWRTGASSHASQRERYVIVLAREKS